MVVQIAYHEIIPGWQYFCKCTNANTSDYVVGKYWVHFHLSEYRTKVSILLSVVGV